MISYEINFVCDGEKILGPKFPGVWNLELGTSCHHVWCEGIFETHNDPKAWEQPSEFGWIKLTGGKILCPKCNEARKAGAK